MLRLDAQENRLHGLIDHSLNSAAFRINRERSVVVRAIVFSHARRTVVSTTLRKCRSMELVDGFARGGAEREMESRTGSADAVISQVEQQRVPLTGKPVPHRLGPVPYANLPKGGENCIIESCHSL